MRAPTNPFHPRPLAGLLLGLAITTAGLGCGMGVRQQIDAPAPDAAAVVRDTRLALEAARRLRQQGRLDAALVVTRRALAADPDDAALHRLQASLLEDLGRGDEADEHRRRAAQLAPVAPLPDEPIARTTRDWLVVLLPSPDAERARRRAPGVWPGGPEDAALRARLALRLPEARVTDAPPQEDASVASLGAWLATSSPRLVLSLQLERAWCGDTVKDGPFAMVWLRAALAAPSDPTTRAHAAARAEDEVIVVREIVADPPAGPQCAASAVARALEQLLVAPGLPGEGLEATAPEAELDRTAIHRLFPDLDRRIDLAIEEGRRWLSIGSLEDARRAFERGAEIDPDDLDVRSYLAEIDTQVELSRQLARRRGQDPSLSPVSWTANETELPSTKRDALEEQLRIEERRRQELLTALAVLGNESRMPDAQTLAALHPSEIVDPDARGPALARALLMDAASPAPVSSAGRKGANAEADLRPDLELRVLHDPGGDLVARYYFEPGSEEPLLAEEDLRGDGRMDRWIAYRNGRRQQVWETGDPSEPSDLHLVYAADGETIERIEIDGDGDGRVERIFVYEAGQLSVELRDTNGDSRFDLVQHYDGEGLVRLREEDLDADGAVDVRTSFSRGRIVRREILSPEAASRFP